MSTYVDSMSRTKVPLWSQNKSLDTFGGDLADERNFAVYVTITTEGKYASCLLVEGRPVNETTSDSYLNYGELVDAWVNKEWEGVVNLGLWAAAGCSPNEARFQQKLPADHPVRFTPAALHVLADLRAGGNT